MIITAILNRLIDVIGYLVGHMISLPVVNDISNILSPYINTISYYIINGAKFISFFIPVDLIQTLLPIILAIETALFTLDVIKFVIKIIGSLK